MSTGSTGGTVCKVCPHACRLEPGERGVCGVRVVQDGQVRSTNYALSTALALDPIEKKPLARFYPGSLVLSIGGFGCNLDCPFCQNWQIARGIPDYAGEKPDEKRADESAGAVNKLRTTAARIVETQAIETRTAEDRTKAQATRARAYPLHARYIVPEELVAQALVLRERGNIGIAFTYNEPLVSYEYVRDTAILAHDAGLKTVLVTNGYANPGTLAEVFAHIDAANIDLKAFNQDFYDLVGAPRGLVTVKRSIEYAVAHSHLEVTTLIVPGLNDDPRQIEQLSRWLAGISADIPLHLSRFHPAYRMLDTAATPRTVVLELVDVARQYLTYVYAGNL